MRVDNLKDLSSAEVGRLASVSRAAVANWRKRHADFPKPVGGSANSPTFNRGEMLAWLRINNKIPEFEDVADPTTGVLSFRCSVEDQQLVVATALLLEMTPEELVLAATLRYIEEFRASDGYEDAVAAYRERSEARIARLVEFGETPAEDQENG